MCVTCMLCTVALPTVQKTLWASSGDEPLVPGDLKDKGNQFVTHTIFALKYHALSQNLKMKKKKKQHIIVASFR